MCLSGTIQDITNLAGKNETQINLDALTKHLERIQAEIDKMEDNHALKSLIVDVMLMVNKK
ncbi:MAG: hypothetical protein IPI65_00230 [Bacteroidetes bacterium]|nr:hypothetical protein [Bacteroidota bacterium]